MKKYLVIIIILVIALFATNPNIDAFYQKALREFLRRLRKVTQAAPLAEEKSENQDRLFHLFADHGRSSFFLGTK